MTRGHRLAFTLRKTGRRFVTEFLMSSRTWGGFKFFAGLSKKAAVPAKYRDAARLYTVMADFTVRMALQHYPTAEPVYLITDNLPIRGRICLGAA